MSFCSFSKGEIYRNHFEAGKLSSNQFKVFLMNFTNLVDHSRLFWANYTMNLGKYVCKECGHDLFRSEAKYEHETPWPAFTKTILPDSVSKREERKGALKVKYIICL